MVTPLLLVMCTALNVISHHSNTELPLTDQSNRVSGCHLQKYFPFNTRNRVLSTKEQRRQTFAMDILLPNSHPVHIVNTNDSDHNDFHNDEEANQNDSWPPLTKLLRTPTATERSDAIDYR